MTPLKIALGLLAAAAVALSAAAADLTQDAEKKPGAPCDLATIEDVAWCFKCKKPREKEQLEGEKCKECQTPTEKIKVCVKKWIPRCGMHGQTPHLENCCKSKKCCVFETLRSPIVFKCEGCGQSARDEAKIAHDAKAHDKKIVKTCELSGTQPHGGEPIK
jgi:hypothetical protein